MLLFKLAAASSPLRVGSCQSEGCGDNVAYLSTIKPHGVYIFLEPIKDLLVILNLAIFFQRFEKIFEDLFYLRRLQALLFDCNMDPRRDGDIELRYLVCREKHDTLIVLENS